MVATKTFRHQDYDLICTAKPVNNGKFVPALTISKQVWPSRPREIAVERGDHQTEDTAIEAAHRQGVEWVLHYG